MADGRRAATVGSVHECPMVDSWNGPHGRGKVITGVGSVKVSSNDAAVVGNPCTCHGAPAGAIILMGHPRVIIGKRYAAREWDLTAHGGHVLAGSQTVFYGEKTDADRIQMAIDRIRASKFGQTEEGQKVVKKLEELQRQGRIRFAEGSEQEKMDLLGEAGKYDPEQREIILNRGGPQKDDVDGVARSLTHEGTHALIDDKELKQPYDPTYVDEETRCWQNESELYKEQRSYAPGSAPDQDKFLEAKDKDAYVEELYKDQPHPLLRRPPGVPKRY